MTPDDGATPINEEERESLIPSYITLRGELNEAEQANILEDEAWAFTKKRNVLDERPLNNLHKRMFVRPKIKHNNLLINWRSIFRHS